MTVSDNSVTIAIMGATGSGKSSFINLASDSALVVSNSLESCTSEVQASKPFMLDGQVVTLIDTPGFDDTVKTQAQILRHIADFLAATYKSGRRLNGVIFCHRISDYRMGGISRKNFRLFSKLCGDDSLKNVVIMTNMWGDVKPEVGARREKELAANEMFFKPALEKGSRMVRHDNTVLSAHNIIRQIMGLPPATLGIQREIVVEHMSIVDTAAGQDIQAELEMQTQKHREELRDLRKELNALLVQKSEKHAEELKELKDALREVRGQLEVAEHANKELREASAADEKGREDRARTILETMQQRESKLRELHDRSKKQEEQIEGLRASLTSVEQVMRDQEVVKENAQKELDARAEAHQADLEQVRKEFEAQQLKETRPDPVMDPQPSQIRRRTVQAQETQDVHTKSTVATPEATPTKRPTPTFPTQSKPEQATEDLERGPRPPQESWSLLSVVWSVASRFRSFFGP